MTATPFNQRTIDEFHARQGRGIGGWGDNLLLMTSTGVKTGQDVTTPLVFRRDGDRYVVVASKGGAPQHPLWLHSLKVNPVVELELPSENGTERIQARATIHADGAERDRLYAYMTEVWPAFADYQHRTERTIPVVTLEQIS
jgi:deazaflavin-dependent oxidoreductase (nitroreductase family)